jgi:Cd2+/Zn2+-exporting ATPase
MPPEALLGRLADDLQRRIDTLLPGLQTLYTTRDEGHLWTFTGEDPVLSYAQDMIANARHEAMMVLTDNNLERLHKVITEAHARGVSIGALLTGEGNLEVGDVSHHPPRESQLHKLADSFVVVVDEQEVLIASSYPTGYSATVTTNANMVQIGRQFVWMELFTHRIFSKLGPEVLDQLDPEDRHILESVTSDFSHQ